DCFAGCGCDDDEISCQVLLDYMLFLLDRAIDLYAVGIDPDGLGEQERRATAVGLAVGAVLDLTDQVANPGVLLCEFSDKLKTKLATISGELLDPFGGAGAWDPGLKGLMVRELRTFYQAEEQTERLVRSLTQQCDFNVFNFRNNQSLIRWMIRTILQNTFNQGTNLPSPVQMPSPIASSMASMGQNRPDYWSA
ncbi:MAG: hypothetical protein E5V51_12830, partial [Mesorhizobium sp.]